MKDTRLELRLSRAEKKELSRHSTALGIPLSDYIRRKLFYENPDIHEQETRYVAPQREKHHLVNITVLYKLHYLIRMLLEKQYVPEEITQLEEQALEYARQQRQHYGYYVIREES